MKVMGPRTIRGQLILGLVLLQALLLVFFAVLLIREERSGIQTRAKRRLVYQASLLSIEATRSLQSHHPEWLNEELSALLASRAVLAVRITDMQGNVMAEQTKAAEGVVWKLKSLNLGTLKVPLLVLPYAQTGDRGEAIALMGGPAAPLGYAWVMEDPSSDQEILESLLRDTVIFGALALLGCVALSTLLARSITKPLSLLMAATRRLIRDPETREGFPLEMRETNEAAEVASAFNLLVSSMAQQRSGLNDTLGLLDSMLANAPVGFAFFDRDCKFVRVNRFLSDVSAIPVGEYLGHSIHEFFSARPAALLAERIDDVFLGGRATRDLELTTEAADFHRGQPRAWVVNLYPVRVGSDVIRWAGAVFIDATERKRGEDALRKSEKLAATGRLAASIAHEINNPLESVTNLLYLLQTQPSLDLEAKEFAKLAEQEVARVSEMAQRTLRFYRQSTLPAEANLAEVLDSVLQVHKGRFMARHIDVQCRFQRDVRLFSFAGELRQVFANLIGNALDASPDGGSLKLTLRSSHEWKGGRRGVRVTVADTGCGMSPEVRRRIFEPFYTTKDATGTGLGLWISSEILEKHGATISVRSRVARLPGEGGVPGQTSGTVFMIFFPEEGVARMANLVMDQEATV